MGIVGFIAIADVTGWLAGDSFSARARARANADAELS